MAGTPDFGLLDVRMLGSLEVARHQQRPVTIPGKLPKKAIAMLALHPDDGVRTAELVQGAGTTPGTLDNCMTILRRALGKDIVERAGDGYRLTVSTDATRFKKLLRQAQKAAAGGSLELALEQVEDALLEWRGEEPLPGLSCPGLAKDIADLKARQATARKLWCDLSLRTGRHEEALPLLRLLTGNDPLSEWLCELLVIALHEVEGAEAAIGTYEKFRKLLSRKSAREPRTTLQDLRKQIDAGAATLLLARWTRPGTAA